MKEYIGVDLGKGGGGEKDRWGKVTGRATLAMTQAAMRVGASATSRRRLDYGETADFASGVFFAGCAGADPLSAASCRRNTGKANRGKTPITPTVIMSLPRFE
jgi:hypothetical protein